MAVADPGLSADEKRLAELGYKQELNRGWSGFSNFAISLTIICILSGCFTTYGQAWNNGGPIAISIGWPVISILVLLVGLSMAELASKFPTAGGIYYWAYSLGGVRWAWFTGWFNLLGLVAIIAAVDYGAASFLNSVLALYGLNFILNFTTTNLSSILHHTFILFVAHPRGPRPDQRLLLEPRLAAEPDLGLVDARWRDRDRGRADLRPLHAPERLVRVRPPDQQQRLPRRPRSGAFYWFFILPLGFLLTMYTFTGYDASAHLSEETHDAERAAPRGLWTSIAYSAVGGWVAAARDHVRGDAHRRDQQGRRRRRSDHRVGAQHGAGQARARHLDHRPAVLRDGLRRGRVADGVRVLPRRRRARPPAVAAPESAPDADLVGAVRASRARS